MYVQFYSMFQILVTKCRVRLVRFFQLKSNQLDVPEIIAVVIIYVLIHERTLGDGAIP